MSTVWGCRLSEYSGYCSHTSLHTLWRLDSLNIVCVPRPIWQLPGLLTGHPYGQANYFLLTHQCTDKFSLCCHNIQYCASESCLCPECCIQILRLQTPYHSAVLHFFIPTLVWFVGAMAGVTGRPFLSFLDGTLHKQCLIIILYPAWDPATFCCFSGPNFGLPLPSSWWGNALGFPKPQIYGVLMIIITLVEPLWHHNDNYCYVTMDSQSRQ